IPGLRRQTGARKLRPSFRAEGRRVSGSDAAAQRPRGRLRERSIVPDVSPVGIRRQIHGHGRRRLAPRRLQATASGRAMDRSNRLPDPARRPRLRRLLLVCRDRIARLSGEGARRDDPGGEARRTSRAAVSRLRRIRPPRIAAGRVVARASDGEARARAVGGCGTDVVRRADPYSARASPGATAPGPVSGESGAARPRSSGRNPARLRCRVPELQSGRRGLGFGTGSSGGVPLGPPPSGGAAGKELDIPRYYEDLTGSVQRRLCSSARLLFISVVTQSTSSRNIPFSRPVLTGAEIPRILEALASTPASCGRFGRRCEELLFALLGRPTLLVTSATHALEMAAVLLGIGPGDEVIVPAYTISSTANAFVLRGAKPVFADVDASGNLDPADVARVLSGRTRAVVPVHYGGNSCDLDELRSVVGPLPVIEDAAQAIGA